MSTCATCAHWTPQEGIPGWGYCLLADVGSERFTVIARDDTGIALETRSDFGCVEYQPRIIAADLPSGPNPGIDNPGWQASTESWGAPSTT